MVNPVHDRVAIVTGGTQGIGQAITKSLLQEDLRVVICSRNEEKITSCLKELRVLWGDAIKGFKCDVRSYSQVINLIDFTVKEYGSPDVAGSRRLLPNPEATLPAVLPRIGIP